MNSNSANDISASGATRTLKVELLVLLLIVAVGFLSRFLLSDIPNFKPVAAIALFGGFYFQRNWLALGGFLAIMMLSDFFLGSYPLTIALSVYLSLGLGCWIGQKMNHSPSNSLVSRYATVSGAGLVLACVFFFVTNLAVWSLWYPQTTTGLASCFTNAIPFFKYTLASNLLFSVGLFAIYDVAVAVVAARTGHQLSTIGS